MATTAPAVRGVLEEKGVGDEAEQKLLGGDEAMIVPVKDDDGLLVAKSSKKEKPNLWPDTRLPDAEPALYNYSHTVKLPEDEGPAVGAGRFTIGPAPERDWEMVPPDGKWGWCVLVGATLVNILIPGTIKSFGVLLVEFNDVFHATPSSSSGIVALCYFLYSSLGPLSSILSVKWSYRTVTLIGGSFAAFGMIFSSMAFSIGYLYFSFGAMVGTGAGLAFPPTVYIVTSYFVRLRGLANGICMSGSAFGSIILPPVLRYLLEEYGYKGAVLILGGIMLNVWAAALLFQPVEQHMVKRYKDLEEEEDGPQNDILFEEEEPIESYNMTPVNHTNTNDKYDFKTNMKNETNTPLIMTSEKPDIARSMTSEKADIVRNMPSEKADIVRNMTSEKFQQKFSKENSEKSLSSKIISSNAQLRPNVSKRRLSYNRPMSRPTFSSASIGQDGISGRKLGSQEAFGRKLSFVPPPKRNLSTTSFAYSTTFHGSTLSTFEQPNEFASQFSLKSVTESVADVAYCCFCCKKRERKERSKIFDITLLTDPAYLVILFSVSTVAISYTNFLILLPSHAANIGFDKSRGAYLLSTVSAFDLVGRIGGSAICDLNLMPKTYYFIGGLFFSGISLIILPFLQSYIAISVCCGFFGLVSGINCGVTTLVLVEIIGADRLMSSYGISLFNNGILQLVGPIICGIWFEHDKNFFNMFITFGFIFLGGTSLWIFMPFINKYKREKAKKANEKPTKV